MLAIVCTASSKPASGNYMAGNYIVFSDDTTLVRESFASPKSIVVLGS